MNQDQTTQKTTTETQDTPIEETVAKTEPAVDKKTGDKPVETVTDSPEVIRLKAELAKQKAALDKATNEAGTYKKQLRAKQSAEEQQAEAERERQEAIDAELKTLRRCAAVSKISRDVLTFVENEEAANTIADFLYGADDVDAALNVIKRAWATKEKKLRAEYGRIPAPGIGGDEGPVITKEQFASMGYLERSKFARNHPDSYAKLVTS